MRRQPHAQQREKIIGEAIGGLVSELRLIDPIDYAAFLRLDLHSNLEDIVQTAAELYFAPDFIGLGHGGQARITWNALPEIDLDLVMRPSGLTIHFLLRLKAETAEVRLAYLSFDNPSNDPTENTRFMRDAIANYVIGSPVRNRPRPSSSSDHIHNCS